MATASASLGYYTNTLSGLHAHRPIRPLPRRRLRSRLSDEEARSILDSSSPGPSDHIFQAPFHKPYEALHRPVSQSSSLDNQPSEGPQSERSREQSRATSPPETARSDVEAPARGPTSQLWTSLLGSGASNNLQLNEQNHLDDKAPPQSLASSVESIDGYDSFENTNNKKKRKIPGNGGHHSSLSTEMASMGLSSTRDGDTGQPDLDGSNSHQDAIANAAVNAKAAMSMSSTGRGKFGRNNVRRRSGKSPLGLSVNGPNSLPRDHQGSTSDTAKENLAPYSDSQAVQYPHDITSAASSKSNDDGHGSDNILAQHPLKKSSAGMAWPTYGYTTPYGAQPGTLPNGPSSPFDKGDVKQAMNQMNAANNQSHLGYSPTAGAAAGAQPRKTRRPLIKQYAIAARDRRLRQNYNNFHHPPKEEDVWICEYCEYEAIFGAPPSALIRQYESKDRRERRRLAEKRRLLEKAKMKGKRGKKGGKNSKAGNTTTQPQQQQQFHKQQQSDPQDDGDNPQNQTEAAQEDFVLDEPEDATTPTQAFDPASTASKSELSYHKRPPTAIAKPNPN